MKAVLLAAGVGKRLKELFPDTPKCMVEVDGKTILQRHLEHFARLSIDQLVVVVGYQSQKIKDLLSSISNGLPVSYIQNDRYTDGSIYSLYLAREILTTSPSIIMDADVIYPRALLERLIKSEHSSCYLMDTTADETGEEMMLGADEGRVLEIDRRLSRRYQAAGEGVGFLKLDPDGGKVLAQHLSNFIQQGKVREEYEAAMNTFLKEYPVYFEETTPYLWTEVDFAEDIRKAEAILRRNFLP